MTLATSSGPLAVLTEWASTMGAFRRNRMPIEKKVVAAALCNGGYSYREVAQLLGGMSYIAARDAYMAMLTSLPEEQRRFRREIAVDAVEFYEGGRSFHLWLARDTTSGEILVFHASPSASVEDATRFLAAIGKLCENKPLLRMNAKADLARPFVNLDLYFSTYAQESLIGRLGRLFRGSAS